MRTGNRVNAGMAMTIGTIIFTCLTSTAIGAKVKLSNKQIEEERTAAKAQFNVWFDKTFTKCDQSYFAKSKSYSFVYELVGPSFAFGNTNQSFDELNNITTVAVALEFSATKTRMSARPDTLLWMPGLRGMLSDGSEVADVTAKRVNNDWTIEPGRWFYANRIGPIPCNEVPASMAPASHEATAQPATHGSAGTARSAEPESDNVWYSIATLACERQDPSEMLALGKLLGLSMSTRDEKEKGKVVATMISASDGSQAKFYRGKARCEAVLQREEKDLDRYK